MSHDAWGIKSETEKEKARKINKVTFAFDVLICLTYHIIYLPHYLPHQKIGLELLLHPRGPF